VVDQVTDRHRVIEFVFDLAHHFSFGAPL